MAARTPPYTITSAILARAEEIGEAIGRAEAAGVARDLRLRRINRIRTIRGSLAIEGNRLSEDQIGTILDGKPVVGPLRDIQEARNAIEALVRDDSGGEPGSRRPKRILPVRFGRAPRGARAPPSSNTCWT